MQWLILRQNHYSLCLHYAVTNGHGHTMHSNHWEWLLKIAMVENHEFTEAVNFSVCHEFFWLLWFVVIFIAALLCQNSWISCANHYKWPHLSLSGALNRVFTYCLTKDVKQTRYRWAHTHTYSMKILTISKLSQVAPTYMIYHTVLLSDKNGRHSVLPATRPTSNNHHRYLITCLPLKLACDLKKKIFTRLIVTR